LFNLTVSMKKKTLLGITAALLLILVFTGWKFFLASVHPPQKKYFYISTGESFSSVRQHLRDSAIIGQPLWFDWAAKAVGFKNIRPGRYEIKPGTSIMSLVRMLKNGRQSPVNFVVTKIRTRETLAARIGKAFECDSLDVINFINSPDSLQSLGFDSTTIMAAVLPLTYEVNWNTTAGTVMRQFAAAYRNFWTDTRKEKARTLGLTPVEVVTLASIIDEETNAPADRAPIASVYLNRLAKGMPLQADPTVKYALREFGLRRIYLVHTRVASPYNTYVNKGLPPGPICTPTLQTVDAVLDAPKTSYFYFVASPRFDGSHDFSATYEEHQKKTKLYQQELNKRNIH